MHVGLIPPKGLENYALRSKFHLALAIPELMERRMYAGMYTRVAALGDFVVLDNGIAEKKPAEPALLLEYAKRLKANEVVLPDVLTDAKETVKAVETFLRQDAPLNYSFMAVAQGTKISDYLWCVERFANISFIQTIGIPRHMLETIGQRACRIDLARKIHDEYPQRFEIHLLGTNPVWLHEVKSVAKYAPHIRSVDTSMPFSYALAGEVLETTSQQITRPHRYFEADWSKRVEGTLLHANIRTLLKWADANVSGIRTQTSASKLRGLPTEDE